MDASVAPDSGSGGRTVGFLLAAVLTVGLALRLWLLLTLPSYFDDHYVFNNIARCLDGTLQPRHSFYGTLSYLPQALALAAYDFVHSRTGIGALSVHGSSIEGFTLGAFRIMRAFVVAYALLSIVMIYLVGRRLFSPAVGVIAALVLAAYPQHLRSSTQLKPDMLASLLTLVALYWTAGAAQSPRLARVLLAGAGVGLAASAKYTGIASALPLAAWALWTGWRDRRRWGWLLLSGVAAAATFLALNPFVGSVLYYVPRLVKGYAAHGRAVGSDHLVVLRKELGFLIYQHGWILGPFLLLGAALLARQLWRGPQERDRVAALLPLALCGHFGLYAAATLLFRDQNLLPALMGTALVCAWGMVRCGLWIAGSRVHARAPVAALVVSSLPGVLLQGRSFAYCYQAAVPQTWLTAQRSLRARLAPLQARDVVCEPAGVRLRLSERGRRSAVAAVPSLALLSPSRLDLADAEVFPRARTLGPQAIFYLQRRERLAPECRLEIDARPFRHRGTPLLVLLHPWTPAGGAVPMELERARDALGGLLARSPVPLAPGEVASIELLARASDSITVLRLEPGGPALPLANAGHLGPLVRWLTPRFRPAAGLLAIRLPAAEHRGPRSYRLQLWRWEGGPCERASLRRGALPRPAPPG